MPHPLNQQIDRLTDRLRRRGWLTGWSLVGVVLLGAATLLIGFDYATRWSDAGVRWLASGAWLAAVAWAVYRFLVYPRGETRRPGRDEVAYRVEQRFPSLGSRLTSSLEFLDQEENDLAAGSAELRRAVIAQTQTDADEVNFDEVVDPCPLRRAATGLCWLMAGVALVTLLEPAAVATGLARLAVPWSSVDWPRRHHLAFVDAPTRLARGQDFEAVLIDERGAPPADAQIVYRFETTGGRRTERRAPQPSGDKLIAILPDVQQSFSYRATGGDDQAMPWTRVEVVDPPSVSSLTITATPPAYSGLAAGPIGPDSRVLAGTVLSVHALADEPLASAAILIGDDTRIPARVEPGEQADTARIVVDGDAWIAATEAQRPATTRYALEVTDAQGLVGRTRPRQLTIEPDTPPTAVWGSSDSDLFVLPQAIVRISVLLADNLAVRRAAVTLTADDGEDAEDRTLKPLPIYEGSETPPEQSEAFSNSLSVRMSLADQLDLEPLGLSEGVALTLTIEAEDYLPQVGRSATPRRVTIVSDEEFNQRIADAQSQLLRSLRRALETERDAREDARSLAANAAEQQELLDRIATLGFNQRRVGEIIDDQDSGVYKQALQLLEELRSNRVDRPDLSSQLRRIIEATRRLADQELPEASRAIVDAQRSAESNNRDRLGRSLAAAERHQTEVVETLERLTEEMAGWSDLEQFASELADLKQRQDALADATRADAAKTAAGRRSPSQRQKDRGRLAEAQSELSRRFDKLMRAMRRRLDSAARENEAGEGDESTKRLAPVEDTLAEANDRATAGKLRDATRQVRDGRLGRAGEAQRGAARDLEELLETLRNRASGDPAALAKQLRDAQQRLAELQDQLERLDKKPPGDLRRQSQQEERLARATERLSRRLDRLTADQASDSAERSAGKMSDAARQSQQQQNGSSKQSRQQAEEQLRLAEEQIEERIRQLENEVAQRLLDQLATDVQDYLNRQRRLLKQTVELADNVAPGSDEIQRDAAPIAGRQGRLGEKVDAAAEKFAKRKVFSLALGSAANEMDAAADRLGKADPGRATQQHELEAIERLKHIADALTPTPPEGEPNQNQQQAGGQGGQQQQRPPPPFDVAELKMLRLMQLDLNDRTRRFESQAAEGLDASQQRKTARRLSAEQRELADLVQELLNRNNKDPRLTPPKEVL